MASTELSSVLMVDDDETAIFLNKIFLDNLSPEIEVNTARDGEEALDFLRAYLDDPGFGNCLLLLDIEMPILNGWQFLEVYEKEFSTPEKDKIVVTVLSNHNGTEFEERAKRFSFIKECILKPLSDNRLKTVINKHFPNFLEEE